VTAVYRKFRYSVVNTFQVAVAVPKIVFMVPEYFDVNSVTVSILTVYARKWFRFITSADDDSSWSRGKAASVALW